MKYNTTNFALVLFVLSTTLVLGSTTDAYAHPPVPFSVTEISDYIGVGLGDGSAGSSIIWSNFEIVSNEKMVRVLFNFFIDVKFKFVQAFLFTSV